MGNAQTKRIEKWCSKCERLLPVDNFAEHGSRYDGLSAYCQKCHNEYRLEHNKKYCELSSIERYKAIVRSKLGMQVQRGLIIKPAHCTDCGSGGDIEGHHENHDKPYNVTWLCRKCHGETHQGGVSSSPR